MRAQTHTDLHVTADRACTYHWALRRRPIMSRFYGRIQ